MRQRLVEATFNIRFVGGREASAKQLCKTRLALERGTLEVSRLDSGEYGKVSFVEKEAQPLVLVGGSLRELQETETIVRISPFFSALEALLDTFVIAGHLEIDASKQTLAGAHGKVSGGRQLQFDLTTARVVRGAYLGLADHMLSKDLVEHFQGTFLPHLGVLMSQGHSLCSAATDAVHCAAWMRPQAFPKATPPPGASSSGTSTSKDGTAKQSKKIEESDAEAHFRFEVVPGQVQEAARGAR